MNSAPTDCTKSEPGQAVATACGPACKVGIDWLEVSVKCVVPRVLIALIEESLGELYASKCWRVHRNDDTCFIAFGPEGSRMQGDRVGQENRHGSREPWSGVRLPGSACRVAGTTRLLGFLARLREFGRVKVSRLDLALDDYTYSFTPRCFAETVVSGGLDDEKGVLSAKAVTRVAPKNWDWSRRDGGCFWLGGRGSPRLLRVYDKGQESKGVIPALRVELQCRDSCATQLAGELLSAAERKVGLAEVFVKHLVSFIDLREPSGSRSKSSNWPRLPWWHEFVGSASKATLVQDDRSEAVAWFGRMCVQVRGFLWVALALFNLEPADIAKRLPSGDCQAGGRVAGALTRILGELVPRLSPEHLVRLRELRGLIGVSAAEALPEFTWTDAKAALATTAPVGSCS